MGCTIHLPLILFMYSINRREKRIYGQVCLLASFILCAVVQLQIQLEPTNINICIDNYLHTYMDYLYSTCRLLTIYSDKSLYDQHLAGIGARQDTSRPFKDIYNLFDQPDMIQRFYVKKQQLFTFLWDLGQDGSHNLPKPSMQVFCRSLVEFVLLIT